VQGTPTSRDVENELPMTDVNADSDIVTAIVASPRATGRFTILVDGKSFATLSLDVIERLRVRVGASIADRREAIELEEAALRTYDRAVAMLAAQARSARDLERRLVRKGEDPTHVRSAIERLRAAGFVDDAVFARQLARSKLLGAGHSARRLRQELGKRGVARDVADEAVNEVVEEEAVDEVALVAAAARKKLRALRGVDEATRRRRLYGFLARRGYESDTIRRALESLGDEMKADGERTDEGE
jgi:regulatory protein